MKTDVTRETLKHRLGEQAMAKLARWTAVSIYLHLMLTFLALVVVLVLPIVLAGMMQSNRWLALWPVLFIAWWRYWRSATNFDPKKTCPTCQKPLHVARREEGDNYNYYLACSHCGREKLVATASGD